MRLPRGELFNIERAYYEWKWARRRRKWMRELKGRRMKKSLRIAINIVVMIIASLAVFFLIIGARAESKAWFVAERGADWRYCFVWGAADQRVIFVSGSGNDANVYIRPEAFASLRKAMKKLEKSKACREMQERVPKGWRPTPRNPSPSNCYSDADPNRPAGSPICE
jgi:hypothetical protein